MNVQELRYVVAVAQAGSINKAALNLYVSQSTLSRAVQEVEAQIGISLFQRTNKGAIPTHDGLEFIERARRLLLAFDQLEGQYFNHEKAEQETLLVATQRCTPVISAFIEYYQKRCEDKKLLNLALKEDTTDNIIRLVSNRIYGIGILHYTSDQESSFLHKCRSVDLETNLLEVSPVVAQVRYGHPLANRKSILVRELRPYPHVTFADEDITNINYCSDVSQYNPSILEKRIVIQDRGTLRQIVDCRTAIMWAAILRGFPRRRVRACIFRWRTCRLRSTRSGSKAGDESSRRLSRRLLQNWKTPMKNNSRRPRKRQGERKEDGYERTDKTDSKRL